MSAIFIKIFNLGVTAGWIVLAVLLLRPLLQRAPKWISCLLWGIVGLRLVFPFSLESVFSLIPSAEPLPEDIMMTPTPEINSGIGVLNSAVNPIISESLSPTVGASANPMQIIVAVAAYLWVIGIALMLIYGIVSYIRLALKVRVSVKREGNIYFCDEVDSPFILGVLRPRIYLPSGMSGEEMEYVIGHEQAHLKRRDHLWKPIGFVLLAVYWFNPLLWIAYVLLCRDIEMACDEKVIKGMDPDAKKGYSEALLSCSIHRRRIMACPLAFGEVGVKERIKSVLSYKKPAFWIIVVALVATVIVSVCFLTNPRENVRELLEPGSEWRCDGAATIDVTVDNGVRMSGSLSFNGQDYTIVMRYGSKDKSIYAEIFKSEVEDLDHDGNGDGLISPNEYADVSAEHLLIAGSLKARGKDIVLNIERDDLGIGEDELVFKKTRESGNRTVKITDGKDTLYVNVTDCGSEKYGAQVSFIQAKLDDGAVVFVLKWKNRTAKVQIYGKPFEVYRYEGDELIALEHIGAWQEAAVGVSAFSMSYPSFNITEHFDISSPGKYRLKAGAAWVEFEVKKPLGSEFPHDIASLGNGLFAAITDYGCDAQGIEVDFRTIQYRSGNGRSFLINWKNSTGEAHVIGPEFTVYCHDGKKYIPLDNISAWETDRIVVEANSELKHSHMITDHYDISAAGKYRFECGGAWVDFEVKSLHEIYTGLDAMNGLDVYVWQMAQGSYSFAVMPHSDESGSSVLLFDMPGVNAAVMRAILSTYDISEDKIYIIPWQNPISSYIGDYWMQMRGEDSEPYRNMYIAIIRDMILGDGARATYPNVYETEIFDVDGDGKLEICKVGLGLSDGKFMFCFKACESGEPYEYYDTFYTEPMSLKFFETADGKVRLRGVTEKGEVVLYDISVKDGHVKLTKTDARTYLDIKHEYLDFAEVDFSMIDYIVITDGTTGEKTALSSPYSKKEVDSLLASFKQIKGSDPVSSRGYYGFRYHVSLCMDYQEIYSFSIVWDADCAYLSCGFYENVGGFDYPCRYKLTNPSYEYLEKAIGKCFE